MGVVMKGDEQSHYLNEVFPCKEIRLILRHWCYILSVHLRMSKHYKRVGLDHCNEGWTEEIPREHEEWNFPSFERLYIDIEH